MGAAPMNPCHRSSGMSRHFDEYDIIALGGGVGGLVATAGAAYLGLRPAVVERAKLGGDCLWTGCVPSKALIASARLARRLEGSSSLGVTSDCTRPDFQRVMERMRAARAVVAEHDDPERFRRMGADVHFGSARFVSPSEVTVEGVGRLRSKRFIIATGARPVTPSIPGLEEAGYWNHETVFDEDHLPDTIAILGGGPVGVEFAQVFARMGARVTILEAARSILGREDEDVALFMNALLEAEGISVQTGVLARAIERDGCVKVIETNRGGRVRADEIFVATGRRPCTGDLELARAGIETDALGRVKVDRHLRTTSERAWGVGDAAGPLQFTPVAEHMAKIALQNATLPLKATVRYDNVPRVTYTDPEIAHIGESESDARARGGTTYRYELDDLDRAIVDGSTIGFVKVSANRRGRILGATIVGRGAGDLILPLILAKRHGLTLSQIADTVFPYPTMVESIRHTAGMYRRAKLDTLGGTALKKIIQWLK